MPQRIREIVNILSDFTIFFSPDFLFKFSGSLCNVYRVFYFIYPNQYYLTMINQKMRLLT